MVMILDAMERPAAVHVFATKEKNKKKKSSLAPSLRFALHSIHSNIFCKLAVTEKERTPTSLLYLLLPSNAL